MPFPTFFNDLAGAISVFNFVSAAIVHVLRSEPALFLVMLVFPPVVVCAPVLHNWATLAAEDRAYGKAYGKGVLRDSGVAILRRQAMHKGPWACDPQKTSNRLVVEMFHSQNCKLLQTVPNACLWSQTYQMAVKEG